MNITYKTDKENVNWNKVSEILSHANISVHSAQEQEKIFKNSGAVVFVYDGTEIVGVCRALTDGVCQAAIYNVALETAYRGHGIGREMMRRLLEQLKGQNVILYTHPRSVAMYEKFGFRRSKTAMCLYSADTTSEANLSWREKEGFLLPEGYRFVDEYGREDMQRHVQPVKDNKDGWKMQE